MAWIARTESIEETQLHYEMNATRYAIFQGRSFNATLAPQRGLSDASVPCFSLGAVVGYHTLCAGNIDGATEVFGRIYHPSCNGNTVENSVRLKLQPFVSTITKSNHVLSIERLYAELPFSRLIGVLEGFVCVYVFPFRRVQIQRSSRQESDPCRTTKANEKPIWRSKGSYLRSRG